MDHFTGTAQAYTELRPGYPERLWNSLAADAKLDGSSKVLDLGAGPATAAMELAKRAGSVVAADIDRAIRVCEFRTSLRGVSRHR